MSEPTPNTDKVGLRPIAQPGQIEAGAYPVAKNQMVRLLATAPLTEGAVKTLIKHLQMGLEVGLYPKSDEG